MFTRNKPLTSPNSGYWPDLPESALDGLGLLKRAVWVFGLTTGKIEWGNKAALQLWQADNTDALRAKSEVVSAAARERVEGIARRIGRGEVVTEDWAFYPNGDPVVVCISISACAFSGQKSFLCEASLEGGQNDDASLVQATLTETFHQSPIPILVCDRNGAIEQLNTVARSEFRVGVGAHVSSIADAGPESKLMELLCVPLGAQHAVADIMLGFRRRARWWRTFAQAAYNPTSGREAVYLYLLDVTVEKEKTDALAGQEILLEQALNALPVAVSLKDREGRYIFANRLLERYLSAGAGDLKGKRMVDVAPAATAQAILAREEFVWTTGEPLHAEESHSVAGETLQMLSGRELVDGPDNDTLLLSCWVDVTALKAAEIAAARANEAKSSFLAAISHEIRTPMNGVLGLANLLNETSLSDDQQRMLETIQDSGQHLMGLINDILDFSKIEASALSLEIEDFELSGMLSYISDILAPRAKQSDLDLLITMDGDVPTTLRGDLGRLRQILVNLLGNAVKFTRQGGVHLSISLVTRSEEEAVIAFRVEDTGIGISDEDKENLFEPFTQADLTAARRYEGVGLGLAISKRLAGMMRGSVDVTSTLGSGSVFSVEIPFELAAGDEPGPDGSPMDLGGKQVALVGLNDFNRQRLTEQIANWGAEVRLVEHTHEVVGGKADIYIVATGCPICMEVMKQPERTILLEDWRSGGDHSQEQAADRLTPPVTPAKLAAALNRALLIERASKEAPDDFLSTERDAEAAESLAPQTGEALRRLVRSSPARLKVLVAEDNDTNQYVITRMLENLGHSVDVVVNGLEAIEAVRERPYDAVLMDVRMPEMDGIDATKQIRLLPKPACDTTIFAMTADVLQSTVDACSNAGMDGYLSKPLHKEALMKTLEDIASTGRGDSKTPAEPAQAKGGEFDRAMVEGLLDVLGRCEYSSLLEKTVSQSAELVGELTAAARGGEMDEVVKLAHAQRSALGHLGLSGARDLAAALEVECREWPERVLIRRILDFGDAVQDDAARIRTDYLSQPEA